MRLIHRAALTFHQSEVFTDQSSLDLHPNCRVAFIRFPSFGNNLLIFSLPEPIFSERLLKYVETKL